MLLQLLLARLLGYINVKWSFQFAGAAAWLLRGEAAAPGSCTRASMPSLPLTKAGT